MTEHKLRPHYQERRAHADGWEIEYLHSGIIWSRLANPLFSEGELRIVPDEEGWLPWYGSEDGKGPFEGNPMVEVTRRDGFVPPPHPHDEWAWGIGRYPNGSNIILYRLHKETAPAKVKMWQWIICYSEGAVHLTTEFLAEPPKTSGQVIGKAPWTEIEV